jgi:hypothetical protein
MSTELRQTLITRFDGSELRTLCADLGLDYDDLKGEGKENKARELIGYLQRRNRIYALLEVGKRQRPDIQWEDLFQVISGRLLISQAIVEDNKLRKYVQEAEKCLAVEAHRAAVVLGWYATAYHLYRIVESNSIDLFCQSYNKKHKGNYEIKPEDGMDQIKLKVQGDDVLDICYQDLGILSPEEHHRLGQLLEWWKQSSNPTGRIPRPSDAKWLFTDVIGSFLARPIDIEHFPIEFIKPYFDPEADEPLELTGYQAETLIEHVHPDNYTDLMKELMQAYLSPDHYQVHDNVSKLRESLAERLDEEKRKKANWQLAKLLARSKTRSDQPIREIVFWPELELRTADRRTIIYHFTAEFAELISNGQYAQDDADILNLALVYTEAQDQERIIRDLLTAFKDCVVARSLAGTDRAVLKTLITYAKGEACEELAQFLAKAERSSI